MVRDIVRNRRGNAVTLAVASLIALALLAAMLVALRRYGSGASSKASLLVYCASGLRPAVEPLAREFELEAGVPIRMLYGPSGSLEVQIEVSRQGDVYIPAALDPFIERVRNKVGVREVAPIAEMRLVLAVNPKVTEPFASIDELLASGITFGLTNEQAAVGEVTQRTLAALGKWDAVHDRARVFLPTVTELAGAVKQGVAVEAGIIWDATARQFGLRIVELPELDAGRGLVSAAVLETSLAPHQASRFAEYLASPVKSRLLLEKLGYGSVGARALKSR
jgi:ABC-type molybdate transport system substrate-binding protein